MNRSTFVATAALTALAPVLALTGPTATAAPSASDARAAAPYAVSAKINRAEVVAGEDTVRITGRVRPAAAGKPVVLQQRAEGSKRWKKSGTAKVKATGRFVLKDDPSSPGVRFYRVLKPAGNGLAAGRSRELKLSVWAWGRLAYRPAGANAGIVRNTTTYFGTEAFRSSLVTETAGTPGFVEYTLGRKCRTLRATYALTDDSATGATGAVTVTVDGTAKATHALSTGVIAEDRTVDITGAFRLRFDAVASAAPAGSAAIGTPEVLCLD